MRGVAQTVYPLHQHVLTMEKAVLSTTDPASGGMERVLTCSFSFTRRHRLLQASQFKKIFSQPDCRATDQSFAMLAVSNGTSQARLGLAVSKRRIKLAVGRNRIKRLVRDSFRLHQQQLSGLDIVVIDRQGADGRDNGELAKALEQLWARLAKKCKSC